MIRSSRADFLLGAWIALALVGCGGDDGAQAPDASVFDELPTYRPAVLTAVQPPVVSVGSAAFVLKADGEFDADAVVLIDGIALTTQVISATELEADVPAELVEVPGPRWVQVIHTGDGGGLSRSRRLDVISGPPTPVLDALIPDRATAGSAGFVVTVAGWNFTSLSVASWAGSPRTTTRLSSAELTFAVTAEDLVIAGPVDVTVATPGADPSTPLVFTVADPPSGTVGVIERASVTSIGGQTGGGLQPSMSADGRYVAFSSSASDVVSGDGCCEDVFVRDTCHGAGGCTPSTVRISVSTTGGDSTGYKRHAAISATGRYVAFVSNSSNLVADAIVVGSQQVFVRDTCLGAPGGCVPTTIQASLRADGGQPGIPSTTGSPSAAIPSISGNGRFVAFESSSPDMVAGDTTTTDVYLRDTCLGVATGCTPSTVRISESIAGVGGSSVSGGASVSADGRFVAFFSVALNLDGQPATMFRAHAYVRDTCFGVATGCTPSMYRADVGPAGVEADKGLVTGGYRVALSGNGRYVTFSSLATNLTTDTVSGTRYQVFVRETCAGVATGCTPSTVLASGNAGGGSNDDSWGPQLSGSGRYLVFASEASDLVAGDTNTYTDVFVRDLCWGAAGCTPETRRVSISAAGVEGNYHVSDADYVPLRVTDDGARTAFGSTATNLVTDDTNTASDCFVAGTGFTP